MNWLFTLLLAILLFMAGCHSKDDAYNHLSLEQLNNQKTYRSIEEGLANPDSVYYIHISSSEYETLPDELVKFNNLQGLVYYNGKLKVVSPEVLTQLSHLQILQLINLPLEKLPQEIQELKSLKILSVRNTELTELPEGIFQLDSLEEVNLGGLDIPYIQLKKLQAANPEARIELSFGVTFDGTLTEEELNDKINEAVMNF